MKRGLDLERVVGATTEEVEKLDVGAFEIEITEGLTDEERKLTLAKAEEAPAISSLLADKEHFIASEKFFCNNQGIVEYVENEINIPLGQLKFLHEYAHRTLSHTGEVFDHEALKNERIAWLLAIKAFEKLGGQVNIDLSKSIRQMLGTYEKFVQNKSVCPSCGAIGSEHAPQKYTCGKCYNDW